MSLFKKPYEREAKTTLNVLIYGRPGIGKTTLACSADGVFLFDFDRGIDRVEAQYQAQNIYEPTQWEDLQLAVSELAKTPAAKVIVVDTIGKLLDLAVDYVRRTRPNLIQNDGTPSVKGYGYRNQLFKEFLSSLNAIGRSVVFVSHEVEEKQKINREEITTMRPNITGSNRNEIIQDLDMLGYMQIVNGQRTITFDQNENILAKNSRGIHGQWNATMHQYNPIVIPMLDGKTANTFMQDIVFGGNADFLAKRREEMENYSEVMAVIEEMINGCEDIDCMNEIVDKISANTFCHIFDSKARASAMIAKKCKSLGYVFNKKTKHYEEVPNQPVAAE